MGNVPRGRSESQGSEATEPRFAGADTRWATAGQHTQDLFGTKSDIAAVVASARAGNVDAQRELYRRYSTKVRRRIQFIVHDPELAEDLLQQTFVRLLDTGLRHFRWQSDASFDTWLARIANNLAIDALRYQRTHVHEQLMEDEFAAPAQRSRELARAIWSAIACLTPKQRQVVILHHFGGWRLPDIATHMDVSLGAVHSLHFAARRHMQLHLSGMDVRPSISE